MTYEPLDDPYRLESVRRSGLMNGARDADFDRLTRLAARILGTPSAFVTILDDSRQMIKSAAGSDDSAAQQGHTIDLDRSICRFAVMAREPLMIDDTHESELIRGNVRMGEGLRAYAGVPLFAPDGEAIGALCAIDNKPRQWNEDDIQNLLVLSRSAAKLLEHREHSTDNGESHDADAGNLLASVKRHFRAQHHYANVIAENGDTMDIEREAVAREELRISTTAMQRIFDENEGGARQGKLGEATQTYLHAIKQREQTTLAFSRGEVELATLQNAIGILQQAGDRLQMIALELGNST